MAGAWHPNVPVQWNAIIQATNVVNGRECLVCKDSRLTHSAVATMNDLKPLGLCGTFPT